MAKLDTREWLLTNGLGGFACGTVCDAHTRTYHGWLMAALDPPSQRTLLLSRLEATLELPRQRFNLGTNFWASGAIAPSGYQLLQSFEASPVPTWVWGWADWRLSRQIIMPYGLTGNDADGAALCSNQALVRYRYEGKETAILKLRPLIGDRNFHQQQQADSNLTFAQVVEPHRILLQAARPNWLGTPWQLCWTHGHYEVNGVWYWSYQYPEETQRGLNDTEDLYSPGYLTVTLQPGDSLTVAASLHDNQSSPAPPPLTDQTFDQALQAEQQRLEQQYVGIFSPLSSSPGGSMQSPMRQEQTLLWQQLLRAGDQCVVYRASIKGPSIIAGYPWFNDWGRDTLIALPGLALATQRFDLARGLLSTFSQYCQHGLIPNAFPDAGGKPFYNSIDAALWWIETLGLYLEASQDWDFLAEQYPVVQRIYKGLTAGTLHNIRVDAFDGLVTWDAPDVALTWMDAVVEGQPITPRRGKAVEINALWYSALCWASKWAERLQQPEQASHSFINQARRYQQQAKQVKASLQKFWNSEQGYLYDTIEPSDRPDSKIRPNAIIALSLAHCGFSEQQGRQVLEVAGDRLLTPYGLRSLDPADPDYVGQYAGNLLHRDRAYHQGTVWSWLIGPFIRSWKRFYGDAPLPFDGQLLLEHLQQQACLGSISEIFDGDAPHVPQGAIAQAWSVAELIRHWPDLYGPDIYDPELWSSRTKQGNEVA